MKRNLFGFAALVLVVGIGFRGRVRGPPCRVRDQKRRWQIRSPYR